MRNLLTKTQNFTKESQKSTAVVLCTVEVHDNSIGYQEPIASNSLAIICSKLQILTEMFR